MQRLSAELRSENDEIARARRAFDGPARYAGPWVSAASTLPLRRPVSRLAATAVRRPRCVAALMALLLRTPRANVRLSESPAGRALDEYFNRRWLGLLPMTRLCRGVLLLPTDHSEYLRGRRRQALRTNLRRAAAAGIHCGVVTESAAVFDDISKMWRHQFSWWTDAELYSRLDEVRLGLAQSEMTLAVARDEQGALLAMAAAVIDETVCLIKYAVATSHDARWALHDYLVRVLIGRQVRYLLATGGGPFGALGFSANVQHYQHLLGYELRHVIPNGTHGTPRRLRPASSLAVAAGTMAVASMIRAEPAGNSCSSTGDRRWHRSDELR